MQEIMERLSAAARLLVVTHARPDGDGLGSMSALTSAARAAGKEVATLVPSEVPARYDFLLSPDRPAGPERFAELADWADTVIIVDTCAFAQLDDLDGQLAAARDKIVVIDHHATTDDIGAVRWVDTSSAAAGVMVGELLEALGWPVDRPAAEALLTAMTTDTGWFRFSNTDARCLRAAARLFEAGVEGDKLYQRLFQADRRERMMLLGRALSSMELRAGGRIATMKIRDIDFAETGARQDETENLVNEPMRMGCVEVSMLLVENGDAQAEPCVRVSLRSRGKVDVAAIARGFGGGGHVQAAGLRIDEDIDALAVRLVGACEAAMN
ncbi:MAG: bifunctional oligoribonuclease/PAP phosphatase NrnA [Planctomycetes bacterium]|nr:bifunctional oligoribonuclease/PAP phosphatase NrnA [Planctomycetota bacterium]